MGAVFEVVDLRSDRRRALKVMHPHLVRGPAQRRRFETEVRVGAAIASAHVVEVFDTGVDEATGMTWLLMELLDGETLDARVARLGPLPLADMVWVFEQLGHAIGAAHRAGVLHLDLKLANVLLARSKRAGGAIEVKVLDFGIARVVDASRTGAELTTAGGTVVWMAPEQSVSGERARPSVDVWPIGLIAYFLLTGLEYWRACRATDTGFNPRALFAEVLFEPLVPASARASEHGGRGGAAGGLRRVVRPVRGA